MAALVLLVVLALGGLGVELSNDLVRLLPDDGPLVRVLKDIQHFEMSDTLLVEVDGSKGDRATLLADVDALGERLHALPQVGHVRYRIEVSDGLALQKAVAPYAVVLVPEEVLADRLSVEGLRAELAVQLQRLGGPGSSLYERAFLRDPLDLSGLALQHLRRARSPFAIQLTAGHFLDAEGQRALIMVRPEVSALGIGPDHPVIAGIEAALAANALPTRWFGPHRVARDAARLIHQDVQRSVRVGSVALVLVFLVGFRSLRPMLGSVGPTALAVAAIAAAAALVSPIHGISLGFSAALLGLAADYWIHLYVAAAARPPGSGWAGRYAVALAALDEILPALALSAGSTAGACAVLLLSRYPAVHDLGMMGMAASLGALAGTVLLGPLAFAVVGSTRVPHLPEGRMPGWVVGTLVGITLLLAGLATGTRLDGDPRHLPPSDPDTQAIEQEFTTRYGGFGKGGLAVVRGKNLDEVLDRVQVAQTALEAVPGVSAVGPAAVLPGPNTQARRRAALPDAALLQARIDAVAIDLGFTPEALAGTAARALAPPDLPLSPSTWTATPLESLAGQRLLPDGLGAAISVVVPEDDLGELARSALAAAVPDADLLMTADLARKGIEDIVSELVRLGSVSSLGVLVLLFARYKDLRSVLAVATPVLVAAIWALGAMSLTGTPWNAVSSCGLILLFGLGLDYGIFVIESTRRGAQGHASYAVVLSALTSIGGFGALALTRSPALFGLGLSVVTGLIGALLAALILTPAVARRAALIPGRARVWVKRFGAGALILVNLDLVGQQLFYLSPPDPEVLPADWTLDEPAPGDRRFGPNRLLHAEGIWAQYTEGTPYQRGYAAAAMAPELRERLESQTLRTFDEHVPSAVARYLILRGTALWAPRLDRYFRPEYLAELRGAVDAAPDHFALLGPAFTRKVYYHAIHDIGQYVVDSPYVVGCTGFMAGGDSTTDGHWLLGRNFDFDGGPIFDRDKVVSFVRPAEGHAFVSVSFTGFVGVVSGMNDQRLAVAINAAGTDDRPVAGTPMTLIIREILERASSLDEAEAILLAQRGFVSENVLVVDAEAGEAALFEVTPTRLARLPVQGDLGVANHFRSPIFADDDTNAERLTQFTTSQRQARIDALLDQNRGQLDLARGVEILRDRSGPEGEEIAPGHRWSINADIATHSVVFDATAGVLWVSRYPNAEGGYVAWQLQRGLNGDLTPLEVVPPGDIQRSLAMHRGRRLLLKGGSADEREQNARLAMILMPGHPQPLEALGEALVDQGRCEEARPLLERALAIPPEYERQVEAIQTALERCP